MARKFYCDKCEGEIKDLRESMVCQYGELKMISNHKGQLENHLQQQELMFCKDCRNKILAFIKK